MNAQPKNKSNKYYGMMKLPKKLTLDDVRKRFEARGYILLDAEYVNNSTPMSFVCPYHPDKPNYITVQSLSVGAGCGYCANNKKHTYEDVKYEFENRGYTLISTEYVQANEKLKYICNIHPDKEREITFHNLKNHDRRCSDCGILRRSSAKRHSYEYVKSVFEKRGYILLAKEYINSTQKLDYICPVHPDKINSIVFPSIQNGHGCKYCNTYQGKVALKKKWSLNEWLRGQVYEWKTDHLELYNYKCAISGYDCKDTGNFLVVHHLSSFHKIVEDFCELYKIDKTLDIQDFEKSYLLEIKQKFIRYHSNFKGIVISRDLHNRFHKTYGIKDNTEKQMVEFILSLESSEFQCARS